MMWQTTRRLSWVGYLPACHALVVVGLLIMPRPATSASWEAVPTLGTELSYETNPDNTADSAAEDDAYIVAALMSWRLARSTPAWSLSSEPQLRIRESFSNDGNSQLDGTDFILPANWSQRGRRSITSLAVGYTQLPSREADYQVVNPNTPLPPGGVGCAVDVRGRCRVDETQSRWYVTPSLSYSLEPRMLLGFNGGFSATRYDEADITGRFDYDYLYGSTSLTRTLNPQHLVSLTLNASRYNADQSRGSLENTTETAGFNIGYEYVLSPNSTISVSGGASVSDFTLSGRVSTSGLPCLDPGSGQFVPCEITGTDSNFVGEIFFRQKLDRAITGQLGISRSIEPNSDGAETTVDSISAFIERDLNEKLKINAGASYIDQEAIGAESLDIFRQRFDRTYYRLELGASWRLSRRLSVSGRYSRYLDEQSVFSPSGIGNDSVNVRNQVFSLQLSYTGGGFR